MKTKSGISLIAVLMFMLAATTASIVVFKWIGSENFSSAARLKRTEAYQASESGIDAVRAWLANKAGDVGEVLYQYDTATTKKPILLTGVDTNLLATMSGTKNQNYKVYLTKADLNKNGRKRLEFLSVGRGRDSSKVSQKAIFSVDGLYQITIQAPNTTCEGEHCDFDWAFFGGSTVNTQGRFSSAVINGDLKVQGLSTNKTLIVTGNMEVMDNGEKNIGCKSGSNTAREGDLYVVGYWKARGFNVCGNAYIGGLLSNENNQLKFLRHLYADGGIDSKGFSVDSNLTLGGNLTFGNNEKLSIGGNFVIEKYTLNNKGELTGTQKNPVPKIMLSGDPQMEISGSFWSLEDAFAGTGNSNGYDRLKYLGSSGKDLLIPNITRCSGGADFSCNQGTTAEQQEHYYQRIGTGAAFFSSKATKNNPSTSNKPEGANPLKELASKIELCDPSNPNKGKCVPDPIEIPQETKDDWVKRGQRLDSLVKANKDRTDIPQSCIRLVLDKSQYVGNDNQDQGLGSHWGWNNNKGNNFVLSANECYAKLLNSDPKKILFPENSTEKFLVVNVVNPEQRSLNNAFDGNFIFVFRENMGSQMELPATTNNSKVFIYFKEGATGNMPLNNSCQSPAPNPCKRNYFIFSEKDIAGSSGNATINGSIFLAKGAKVTGSLPDASIEFNKALYDALTHANVIKMTDKYRELIGSGSGGGSSDGDSESDKHYIPVASRLLVELETKEITTEQEPSVNSSVQGKPTILVMPRLVRIGEDQITNPPMFVDFYSYMLMNNATMPTKVCPNNCTKLGGGGGSIDFCSPGKKPKGVYICPSRGNISEFYVQIGSNDNSELEVNISPSPGAVIEKGDANTCKTISLRTNRKPTQRLTVSVTKDNGTGTGWSITKMGSACTGTNNTGPFTCTINIGEQNVNILNVCVPTNVNDPNNNAYVVLSLTSNSGANISKTNNRSIISLQNKLNGKVYRFPMSSNDGTWKDCEQSGQIPPIWADVACSGKRPIELNREWECDADGQATLSITNLGEACELPPGTPTAYAPIIVKPGMDNKFNASLAWKKYNLKSVSGGTLKFVSSRSGQNFTCGNPGGCSDPLYHRAGYVVTSSTNTDYGYCLGQAKAGSCTPNTIDGIVGFEESFILDPTGDIYITLITAPRASMTCVLKKTIIRESQNLEKSDFEVTFSGRGCNNLTNPDFTFSPSYPFAVTDGDGIDITVSSNACPNLDPAICTPKLVVQSNICDYNSIIHNSPTSSSAPNDLCGGLAFNNVLDNSVTIPTTGKCLFIGSYLTIQASTGSTININGRDNPTEKPLPIDGGYYVYVKSGSINPSNWKGISPGIKNGTCKLADCKIGADAYILALRASGESSTSYPNGVVRIERPAFTCENGLSADSAKFNVTQGGDLDYTNITPIGPNSGVNWNYANQNYRHSYGSPGVGRVARMYRIWCGGSLTPLSFGGGSERKGIVCGLFDVYVNPTLPPSYLQVSNYNPYYPSPYDPWCKLSSDCYNTNATVPRPTFGCKSGSTAGTTEPLFNITSNNNGSTMSVATNWNNNTNQSFTATATGRAVYMYQITCDGVAINFSHHSYKDGIRCTTPSGSDAFDVKANCGGSSTTYTLTCGAVSGTGTAGTAITPPTVTCTPSTGSPSTVTTGLTWINEPTSWANPTAGTYSSISVSAGSGDCAGQSATCSGTLVVNPAPIPPTLTCTLPKTNVTIGENINAPTLDCGNGTTATGQSFASSNGTINSISNWDNGNSTYYTIKPGTGTTTITVSNVKCGTTSMLGTTTCGTITVNNPTCNNLPTTAVSGSTTITPSVSCGTAGSATSQTFSTPNSACSWSGSVLTRTSTGNCELRLASLSCGGNSLGSPTSLDIECYTGTSGTNKNVSVTVNTLTCGSVPTTGTAGTAITPPTVQCNGTTVSSGLNWTNAPNWSSPTAGTYSNISVSASSGTCSGLTANCTGTLTVSAATTYTLTCDDVSGTVTAGTSITQPTVKCNGTTVSSGLNWTNAPNWGSPGIGIYNVSVSASSGNCIGKSTSCGTVVVSAAAATCGSGNATPISNPPSVGNCLNLTMTCTSDNNLPLKVYNDGSYSSSNNVYSGTIYCSDGSSKPISCPPSTNLCESSACPAGTTGAWLYITSVGGSPQVRSNCY